MNTQKFTVTCLNCKQSDTVDIDNANHRVFEYGKGVNTNITSARWRKDNSWGFECICGNYDLLAEEEKADFEKLVNGSPLRLAQIAEILKEHTKRFNLEVA